MPPSFWNFSTLYVGYEANGGLSAWTATASNNACQGCTFVGKLVPTNTVPVLEAYFIAYQANLQAGFGDCNTDFDGNNLCTRGAQWIRDNRPQIINMYAKYAAKVNQVAGGEPVVWWLEGDFFQYTGASQSGGPLSYADLGQLARDIICAIKSNEPAAVVAINHSPWITDAEADGFWSAQPTDVIDLVYVQGSAGGFSLCGTCQYNQATASYAWLHQKTGRPIMGNEALGWANASTATINQRIANGVLGAQDWSPPGNYQSLVEGLRPQLSSVCQ